MTYYFNQFNITDEKFNEISVGTKYKQLQKFFNKINALRKVKSRTEDTKKCFLSRMELLKYLIYKWDNKLANTISY